MNNSFDRQRQRRAANPVAYRCQQRRRRIDHAFFMHIDDASGAQVIADAIRAVLNLVDHDAGRFVTGV